jgi:hypothetical protein
MEGEKLQGLLVPQVALKVVEESAVGVKGEGSKRFLKGPIPLPWMTKACGLPGQKSLAVALAIWWVAGLRKRRDHLLITSASLEHFGVRDRSAKYRALAALEGAGLIHVLRQTRKNPSVSILDVA